MNNKGQALVFVILLIPLILLLFMGTIQGINVNYQKKKIISNLKTVISSCYDKCSDDNIKELLKKNNINYNFIDIKRNDDLEINIKVKADSFINDSYLNLTLVGTKVDDKIIIKRVS